ncbi:MAG: serine/threonine protein kinase [Muribaculaceae bacterium]
MKEQDRDHIDPGMTDDSDSAYLGIDEATVKLDFGELFSHEFTNIRPYYSSPHGPVEIYTANRYGKRYILKGLKRQYRTDPIYTMSLAKEFEIGIQLDHPNIRRTIGLENIDGLGRVIVLEYVDGCTLDTLLTSSALTISSGRAIAAQIADALGYIHSKQVYHRDLKPTNILVAHNGNVVKIIDFNLSDREDFVILKNPSGTRHYMAPELLSQNIKPSAVADIYSFGVVAGELAQATGDEALAQAVRKCTNDRPDLRPQSVAYIKLPSTRMSVADMLSRLLSSRLLTYILIFILAALAAAIIIMLTKHS